MMLHNRHIIKTDWNHAPKLIRYWVLSLFVLVAGSLMPFSSAGTVIMLIDPFIHILLYAILSFVPMELVENRKAAFIVSTAMMPLGYLLESLHMIVSNSSFNAFNALFNNIGVLSGMIIGLIMRIKHHFLEKTEKEDGISLSQTERR